MENLEPNDDNLKIILSLLSPKKFEEAKLEAIEHYSNEKKEGKCDTCSGYPCDIIHFAEGKFDHLIY